MSLREVQGPIYYDEVVKYNKEDRYLSTTTDLLNWKHHTPSFMENFRP
jgi:hypothetical protein